jgi:hypothetical protein
MELIFHYYCLGIDEGITDPPEVCVDTQKYKNKNDFYQSFMKDVFVRTKSDDDVLKVNEAYDWFKMWMKNTMPGHSISSKNEFVMRTEAIIGSSIGKKFGDSGWKGYTINPELSYDEFS